MIGHFPTCGFNWFLNWRRNCEGQIPVRSPAAEDKQNLKRIRWKFYIFALQKKTHWRYTLRSTKPRLQKSKKLWGCRCSRALGRSQRAGCQKLPMRGPRYTIPYSVAHWVIERCLEVEFLAMWRNKRCHITNGRPGAAWAARICCWGSDSVFKMKTVDENSLTFSSAKFAAFSIHRDRRIEIDDGRRWFKSYNISCRGVKPLWSIPMTANRYRWCIVVYNYVDCRCLLSINLI